MDRGVIILSICFSLVEAALLVALSLATAVNKRLGEVASGLLYICYALGGLISPAVVWRLGVKRSLLCGLSFFLMYILANVYPKWITLVPTSMLAGFGASFIWTAQGTYITRCAEVHTQKRRQSPSSNSVVVVGGGGEYASPSLSISDEREVDTHHVLGRFNGLFFLIFEFTIVCSQLGSSLFLSGGFRPASNPNDTKVHIAFAFFSVVCAAAIVTLGFALPPLPMSDEDVPPPIREQLKSSVVLLVEDTQMKLMIVSNMAFGFIQGFQNSTFARRVIRPTVGVGNIGVLASVSACAGGMTAWPLGWLSDRIGRLPLMALGSLSHFFMALTLMWFWRDYEDDAADDVESASATDWTALVCVSLLFGLGNCVWNTQNSAVFGDFFSYNKRPAFANLKMQSGAATAVAYFAFPVMSISSQLTLIGIFITLGFTLYALAHFRYVSRTKGQIVFSSRVTSGDTSVHDDEHTLLT